MFSNIPINLLSETQLGGCTALSCVLGRRREEREGGGVDICSNKEGNQQCAHIHVVTHTHTCTHTRTQAGFDVAAAYISSLVGLYVDFRECVCRKCTDPQMTRYCLYICKQWCATAEPTCSLFLFLTLTLTLVFIPTL